MLLHLIESLTTPTQGDVGVALAGKERGMTIDQKKLLSEVLLVFDEAYRLTVRST